MDEDTIKMVHGAGGSAMQDFIKKHILKYLSWDEVEVPLKYLDDSSVSDGVVLKSDSYTVKPIFFPGGDIGKLAVAGSVNDILMIGGEPRALAMGLVIEEGFSLKDLDKILRSVAETSREAEAPVITGDTKVVEKGSLYKIIINMSGFGFRHKFLDNNLSVVKKIRGDSKYKWLLDRNIRPGDKIILTGFLADHAIALLSVREGMSFETSLASDVAPLNTLVGHALHVGGVVAMKDPTRGGLANLLNEWVEKSGFGILLDESKIPIRDEVRSACEYLGIDPLELGNEGKAVIAVVEEKVEEVLDAIREDPRGRNAEIIGEVTADYDFAVMRTVIGGLRVVSPPIGDPVPRIC